MSESHPIKDPNEDTKNSKQKNKKGIKVSA